MTVWGHPSGYRIGAATVTADGAQGTVSSLVVDPATRRVTHLAVEPEHRHHQSKLVPIAMATAEPGGDVRIGYDRDGFDRLDQLEQLDIIDVGPSEPYGLYGPYSYDGFGGVGGGRLALWTDRQPDGEAALRHDTPVCVGGDTVGHVDGLLTGADGRIVAVLVTSGHVWSRRTVAIPVDAVTAVSADGLTIADRWDHVRRTS